jgi:hypothetical protein
MSHDRIPQGTEHVWAKDANRLWIPQGIDPVSGAQLFESLALRALRSNDDGRWHISVSRPNRYPSWDELADARYDLGPLDVEMAMILPPPSRYVNINKWVFHVWEVPDDAVPFSDEDLPFRMIRSRETELNKQAREAEA